MKSLIPKHLRDFGADAPRALLYSGALLFWGALIIPVALISRRVGRAEKIFICALGASQTLASIIIFLWYLIWMVNHTLEQMSGAGGQNPFGL